jgi:hypothetical protein
MEVDRRRRGVVIAAVVLVPLVILVAVAMFMAGAEGLLPWQPDPTRPAITPFANLPGSAGTPVP